MFASKLILFFLIKTLIGNNTEGIHTKQDGLIYILNWSADGHSFGAEGQDAFIKRGCKYQNCYVTNDYKYLPNITMFHVINFYAVAIYVHHSKPPKYRDIHQIYVLYSDEPAATFPIPSFYNNFINLTWTYKLNSDAIYGYISITDIDDNIIGPKTNMNWLKFDNMDETSEEVIDRLQSKQIAVAWFVSNCVSEQRKIYAFELKRELANYNHTLDIYGSCTNLKCPVTSKQDCFALIETLYYFYLSFENCMSQDYVTEKLLTALNHYAVPIVLGGANYTRFMPDGIYLNANILNPKAMAKKINDLIKKNTSYYSMFRWHNHYRYHPINWSPKSDVACSYCAVLNHFKKRNKQSVYANITAWFNEAKEASGDHRRYRETMLEDKRNWDM